MASVFAYQSEIPRIASPWFVASTTNTSTVTSTVIGNSSVENGDDASLKRDASTALAAAHPFDQVGGLAVSTVEYIADYGLNALPPEPEAGPVEYKLHLLLRQRQSFSVTTTSALGAQHRLAGSALPVGPTGPGNSSTPSVSSPQSRQQRLLHLTTQLLWRLKQSSPYHAFSAVDSIVPQLPLASSSRLEAPTQCQELLPGLEQTQGAMYEIGVADDGTFVGLTQDELSESLINLRVMAASLGCIVQILRVVVVGSARVAPLPASNNYTGKENTANADFIRQSSRGLENLYVVEAIVLPDTGSRGLHGGDSKLNLSSSTQSNNDAKNGRRDQAGETTEQLRVSLTGSTTSGKSTLLGTLLTSTLDDARGKSRLNLLKHRHEIASGVTSSVAHELLGYRQLDDAVINYAYQNVDTWTDVHDTAEGGRLILLTDSAGHLRYRRTIVRSLIAWKPHWTLCCIAAFYDTDDASKSAGALQTSSNLDHANAAELLAIAHLELCLKLNLPLVVAITKYDLATKAGLKQTLGRILTILKSAGRVPYLLKPSSPVKNEKELRIIPDHDVQEARTVFKQMHNDSSLLVPIVLTSAVNGIGITKLHALLRHLPGPAPSVPDGEKVSLTAGSGALSDTWKSQSSLFDIDEIFVKDLQPITTNGLGGSASPSRSYILSGLLQRGNIAVGDHLVLGPFPTEESVPIMERRPPLDARRSASYPVTHHEVAMRRHGKLRTQMRHRRSSEDLVTGGTHVKGSFAAGDDGENSPFQEEEDGERYDDNNKPVLSASEWITVRVWSIQNLRLPVRVISQGQCATIGISPLSEADESVLLSVRPRKGMVLRNINGQDRPSSGNRLSAENRAMACGAFVAIFPVQDYHAMEPGAQFNLYVRSIRAIAKVVTVGLREPGAAALSSATYERDMLKETGQQVDGHSDAIRLREESVFDFDDADDLEELKDSGDSSVRNSSQGHPGSQAANAARLEVLFQLVSGGKEFIERGAQVFIMPGQAGDGPAALDGYVGTITDSF